MERYHGISKIWWKNWHKHSRKKRKSEILFIAADLGHYIADAHMPLHTSDNHDGQLTDKGIHSLWESRLPELFVKDYNLPWPQRIMKT
jgi:hypothetical protein